MLTVGGRLLSLDRARLVQSRGLFDVGQALLEFGACCLFPRLSRRRLAAAHPWSGRDMAEQQHRRRRRMVPALSSPSLPLALEEGLASSDPECPARRNRASEGGHGRIVVEKEKKGEGGGRRDAARKGQGQRG
eukprot:2979270-Rhodomonas_salina.1